ncbi:acetylcholinesterase-like isoform X2 [Brevipalpus obovatus]|uniref:acetylcholinesterase-like isoform X2 n=1 Tax=Brevipalpus obovatus TaxID=246614 RepID=UPI003D9F5BC1
MEHGMGFRNKPKLEPELIKKSSSRRLLIICVVVISLFFVSLVLVELFVPLHIRLPDFIEHTVSSHHSGLFSSLTRGGQKDGQQSAPSNRSDLFKTEDEANFFSHSSIFQSPHQRSPYHRVHHHHVSLSQSFADNSLIVSTSYGKLRGFTSRALSKDIVVFLGIPYAQPPIGQLRFARPEPPLSWDGVRDATRFGPQCIQFKPNRTYTPWISADDYMSEDCLYLNIWSPLETSSSQSLKSVMVWIHGGAFFSGSSDLNTYDGRTLSAFGDVVVVSINYRLGSLGFLNMGTKTAPGNQGLHDQVMALKWIQTNIKYFGGDPSQVTLFGQSAGAISVGLHYLSPMSSDLFLRGILQSGAPTVTRLFYEREGGYGNRGITLARMLDCLPENQPITYGPHSSNNNTLTSDSLVDDDEESVISSPANDGRKNANINGNQQHGGVVKNLEDTVECLKSISIEELARAQDFLIDEMSLSFGPTLGDDFLPSNPISLMDIGEIGEQREVLLGASRDEGTFFLHYLDPKLFGQTLNNVSHSRIMQFVHDSFPFLSPRVASLVFSQFLPIDESTPPAKTRQMLSDFIGDSTFTCPLTFFAQLFQKNENRAYFYIFDHHPSNSPWPEWMGILHFDEVQFIFGVPLRYPHLYTPQEVEFSKRLMRTWVSFAKNGVPEPQFGVSWPEYSAENPHYVSLYPGNMTIESGPKEATCTRWHIMLQTS